jgi:hypothetical protein
MTVSSGALLKSIHNATAAMGDKVVSSDATFEIEGFEDISLLIKQFPWPQLTSGGEIEVPTPLGAAMWQSQQIKVHQQGQVTFMETRLGHIAEFFERVLLTGGKFNAKVYEGIPTDFSRVCPIRNAFVVLDNPDRDWENRSQIMTISGTIFFHYYGTET